MNTEKYTEMQRQLQYPTRKQFTIKYYYKNGALIGSTTGDEKFVGDYAVKEEVVDADAYRAARLAYEQQSNDVIEQFKQELYVELGIEDNPKRDALFTKAWDMGHSSGFNEVMYYANELVDLIL